MMPPPPRSRLDFHRKDGEFEGSNLTYLLHVCKHEAGFNRTMIDRTMRLSSLVMTPVGSKFSLLKIHHITLLSAKL